MIDKQRITAKMLLMEENLTKLDHLSLFTTETFLGDFRNVESAKHLLQVTIECMIDICEHISAKKRFGIPDSAAECIRLVFVSGHVSSDKVDTYIAMTKFRNRIVHLYHDVDEQEIFRILQQHLPDIRQFIQDIVLGFGL